MPLIDQQDVITVFAQNGGIEAAREKLLKELDLRPPVRIVSISATDAVRGSTLTAVIETI